jgi:hypothetical protein
MTPVTSPLTASFFFLPTVPRALRVARNFAVAATRFSLTRGVRALGGCMPKSARVCVADANVASKKRLYSRMSGSTFAAVSRNAVRSSLALACVASSFCIATARL